MATLRWRDIFLKWGLPPACPLEYAVAEAELIVVIPFGSHRGHKVAAVNVYLAQVANRAYQHQNGHRPEMIVQWEISQVQDLSFRPQIIGEEGDFHINTREFFEQVRELAPSAKKVLIIAQADHLWRSRWVAEKLGYQVLTPRVFPLVDPDSIQPWARGRVRFLLWELGARIYFWYKGWI